MSLNGENLTLSRPNIYLFLLSPSSYLIKLVYKCNYVYNFSLKDLVIH
jgi:hypothetical protein